MKALAVMYHDVFDERGPDATGMPGPAAARYKLDRAAFASHVRALAAARTRLNDVTRLCEHAASDPPVALTFDDGGVSAHTLIADVLEEASWRGHFLVTAGWVGRPTFLSPAQIRDLRRRGHVVGSHSYSHPTRMSSCTPDAVRREWTDSVKLLSDILGEPVRVASVPGGYYARHVAEPLAEIGVTSLFTSEPRAGSRPACRRRLRGTRGRWPRHWAARSTSRCSGRSSGKRGRRGLWIRRADARMFASTASGPRTLQASAIARLRVHGRPGPGFRRGRD